MKTVLVNWRVRAIVSGRRYQPVDRDPWQHNTLALAVLEAIAMGVAGLLFLSEHLSPWAYIPLAGAGFGVVYCTLLGIVVHEAAQERLFLSLRTGRRNAFNDAVGWLAALPFAVCFRRRWEEARLTQEPRGQRPNGVERLVMVLVLLALPGSIVGHRISMLAARHETEGDAEETGEQREVRESREAADGLAFLLSVGFWTIVTWLTLRTFGWAAAAALLYGLQVAAAIALMHSASGEANFGGEAGRDLQRVR